MFWLWLLSTLQFNGELTRQYRGKVLHFAGVLLTCLGAASYSIYLIHGRVMHLAAQLARQIFSMNTIGTDLMTFIITLIICWSFYLVAERPFVRLKAKVLATPSPSA